MVWQDITFAVVNVFFSYALIPQILRGIKEKRGLVTIQTASITSIGMYIIAFTCFTLGLILSSIIIGISGVLWTIIFIQSIIYK